VLDRLAAAHFNFFASYTFLMKKILCFFSLLLICFHLFAQDDEYKRLIKERETLIQEYNYLNAQNNNFWGKKSKKDLLKIIDNLKAIIKIDSDIINNVQASYVKRNADLTVKTEKMQTERKADTRIISDNIFEMKRQVANLEGRDQQRLRKISDLEEQLKEVRSAKTEHDLITVFATIVAISLLLYIIRLRGKLATKRGK
jgi:CRISPR/Cas system-associated endoribonuclease Cas2